MNNFLTKNKAIVFVIIFLMILIGAMVWNVMGPKGLGKGFISGNGRIEASEVDIATKLGGRLISVFVNEGELVKKDQVLAQMQIDVLQAQLDEAIARNQQAIKMADTSAAQVTVAESNLATAKSVVKQREAELDAAKRRLIRSQSLAKSGAISLQVLDDDRAKANSAKAALSAAESQVAASEAAIISARAGFSGAQSTVAAYIANIKRIEAEINDSRLKSPCDGKVQYKIAQPGEVLAGGGKILSLIDLHDIYMTFFLPETVVGRVAIGSEVRIVLDAASDYVIPAKISFVSSVAQFTPKTVETVSERQKLMFRVKAKVDQEVIERNLHQVKTGLPGVAFLRLDPKVEWPKELMIRTEK